MPTKKIYTKDENVKKEIRRLKKIFAGLDKNKLAITESLIEVAAFMRVSLDEIQSAINEKGYTEKYQNGANQSGVKQSSLVEIHIAMTRNLATVMKQLVDLAPLEKRKDGKLVAFQRKYAT